MSHLTQCSLIFETFEDVNDSLGLKTNDLFFFKNQYSAVWKWHNWNRIVTLNLEVTSNRATQTHHVSSDELKQ